MERPWLASYPTGVPADVDLTAVSSLVALLEKSIDRYKLLPAFRSRGRVLRYSDVDALSRDLAAFLQSAGLTKGGRIALMLPNSLPYPVATIAALRAGLVVVNVNPLYTPRELGQQLRDAGASAIVVLENFAHVLAEVMPEIPVRLVIISRVADLLGFPRGSLINFGVKHVRRLVPAYDIPGAITLRAALRKGRELPFQAVDVGRDDIAFLQYTGGTTGVAKGAMLTHGNLLANAQQICAWLGPFVTAGQERIVTALPLYHIFALTVNFLTYFTLGGLNTLIANPRDLDSLIDDLRAARCTGITGVNTLYNALLSHPRFTDIDFSALKVAIGGGTAVQQTIAERWKQATGRPLVEGYGLTECSPVVTINPINIENYTGTIGLPIPSTDCMVVDDRGHSLPAGKPGELWVRGPQVMKGYWNRPDETAKVFSAEGWLRTGDVAVIDERGYIKLVDRKKDVVLVSGFKVFPNEIEDVVASHPGVLEVAAIGVPDPHSGEVVKIYVVRKDTSLTKETIIRFCREQLVAYKVPKQVEFRESLPKSPIGKILRRELRSADNLVGA
ncbi:MAG: AMP-binding protein [Chromatiales bacterium]